MYQSTNNPLVSEDCLPMINCNQRKIYKLLRTGFIIVLIYLPACIERPSMRTGMEGSVVPSFNLLLLDGKRFNTSSIPAGKPIVLFYFTPNCPFCRAQMKEIVDEIESLRGIIVCAITTGPYSDARKFYDYYKLARYRNIIVAGDLEFYFEKYFKIDRVPYLVIYDEERKMKQAILGKTDVRILKDIAIRRR